MLVPYCETVQSSVVNAESEGSVVCAYKQDRCSGSGARASNLPCRDILLQVLSEGFIFLPGGLVDGSCGYLCVWVLKGDLVITGLVFRESGCLFSRKALCVTRVSFACVNNQ